MADSYNAGDIINKTLVAKSKVPVFRFPYDGAEMLGYVEAGQPVGIVYSYLQADVLNNRKGLWWAFFPSPGTSNYYYAPQLEGLYDVSSLRQQGVISTNEKIELEKQKEIDANTPWYMSILKTALPWVAGIAVAVVAVPELLKRKK